MKDEGKLAGQVVPHCDRIVRESQASIRQIQDQAAAVEQQAGPAAIEYVKTGSADAKAQAEAFVRQAQDLRGECVQLQERAARWQQIKDLVSVEIRPSGQVVMAEKPAADAPNAAINVPAAVAA